MSKKVVNLVQEKTMYEWVVDLFPLNRSLTGKDFIKSLKYIKQIIPELKIRSIPSGTSIYDWKVPKEWNVNEAWVKDSLGRKIIDFNNSNLHLVGYSEPVHQKFDRTEFLQHLHTIPDQPEAIPYVTSYYNQTWGFCIAHKDLGTIKGDSFEVFIDSSLSDGSMKYGELYFPGESKSEILFSTYLCHPSMANNELSGPVIAAALARWITSGPKLKYSYRFLFLPETIGSIAYIERNLKKLKKNLISGWILTCLGDNRNWSYLPSRIGNTLSDKLSLKVLSSCVESFHSYSWLSRGSDERQFCAPGIDLPISSIMRSKYGEFPEYHTSLDNLTLISNESLNESLNLFKCLVNEVENRVTYKTKVKCEPQLSKRKLYPTLSKKGSALDSRRLLDVLSYCDATSDVSEIAKLCNLSIEETELIICQLLSQDLIECISSL